MEYTRFILLEDVALTDAERMEAIGEIARDQDDLGRVVASPSLRARTLELHPELSEETEKFHVLFDPITFQVLAAFPGDVSPPEMVIDESIRRSISEERSGIEVVVPAPAKDAAVVSGHSLESDGVVTENKIGKTVDGVGHYSLKAVVAAFSSGVLLGWLISRLGMSQMTYKLKSESTEKKQAKSNNRGETSGSGI